ncbi:MAG: putative tRNA sulfurtransferase [Thermotoga sp. 50_1627]|uniref:tRNA uracil 4-sulfurtransferase ThiI n=1 Tax=Pseudothermotoga sp. TaxID=2033661 RepID=UPI00076C73FC|nr:MAG: putative tRNA sulfurtransferase [Thermotoga sp. 50_64]KUK25467.1 MAG: putative tRNA sulfurtransferase [Thermotoga sp. 50_1627]MBC7115742.1 tRNA 4-thiouridine(8) synthase ThiI [Pseudothermotoga sp.]MDK2922958.1 tRNA uracil 4-sulfurtransferase [Pseudothermotoga sp.]HBT38994.1 tRNA 4-thiouridine(8) synthase ThiI [Pseudothermotoga sp.]
MIIVRYGEIALKGKNRKAFENKLIENIQKALARKGIEAKIRSTQGRLIVDVPHEFAEIISKVPGVVSVSPAWKMEYEEIPEFLSRHLCNLKPTSFKVDARRINKAFHKPSQQINEEIGAFVVQHFGWKVNLDSPELVVGIEMIEGQAYVFFETIKGVGGLPSSSQGRLVLLMSVGIDSPVAGFLMLKRGVSLIALHFDQGHAELAQRMIDVLNQYSSEPIELIVVNHSEYFQPYVTELERMGKREWTCVICKALMLKKAEEVAKEKSALGIVTGDSLGQVASQTLENLFLESSVVKMPVYRPLIGMDKDETVRIARQIGTFELFVKAARHSCPFRPSSVVTRGSAYGLNKILEAFRSKSLWRD